MISFNAVLHELTQKLLSLHNEEQARVLALWILEWITGLTSVQLIAQKSLSFTKEQEELLAYVIECYVHKHMPLQYIFGNVPFLGLTITVHPHQLIPRPETEYWCSLLIECLNNLKKQALTILDMCTGSGCIALALAHHLPESIVYAVDISPEACRLATLNKEKNNIQNVVILQSDLYTALPSSLLFDLIVSNPPYISRQEWEYLDPRVKLWEDPHALIAEHHGLALLEGIIDQAPDWLQKNTKRSLPQLVLEIGHTQGKTVKELCEQKGFHKVCIGKDLAEKERFVFAYF